MDYQPNVEAVGWFARAVFPGLKQRCPGALHDRRTRPRARVVAWAGRTESSSPAASSRPRPGWPTRVPRSPRCRSRAGSRTRCSRRWPRAVRWWSRKEH
jgi:hypothetical protein